MQWRHDYSIERLGNLSSEIQAMGGSATCNQGKDINPFRFVGRGMLPADTGGVLRRVVLDCSASCVEAPSGSV